jgi:hypothetical protein
MKKLKLVLDDLVVESFSLGAGRRTGTVQGQEVTVINCGDTFYVSCNVSACPVDCQTDGEWSDCCNNPSDFYSCAFTCDPCDTSVNEANTCIAPCV